MFHCNFDICCLRWLLWLCIPSKILCKLSWWTMFQSHRQSQTITDLQQSQSNSIAGIMTVAGIKPYYRYPAWLWLTVCHGFSMALIEIDGLPNLKMGGSFRGKLLVITRWYNQMIIDWCDAPIVRAIAGIKPYLIGGLEHFLFSISYMGCHPSHWLSYFSR